MEFLSRIRLIAAALALTAVASVSGCAHLIDDVEAPATGQSLLKPVAPRVDAIELEVVYVERPDNDPLLGDSLWSELDTISTLDPAVLASLRRNGIRFGVAGSNPPRSLQAAMGVAGGRYNGHRYSYSSGQAMTINASPVYGACEIEFNDGNAAQTRSYQQALCAFRVTPKRLQDGWVSIEFIPEIHHGEMKMRPVPGEQSWEQRPSQLVDPLFDQRFTVELNLGEMVVLSASGDNPHSVGHHFFHGGTTDSKLQRLLIVRVVDMQRLDPLRSE